MGVLQRLAAVLGVPVSVLLGEPSYAPESTIHPVAPAIQAALMTYRPLDKEPAPTAELLARVAEAWRVWQATARRFTGIAPLLPPLITDVSIDQPTTRRE